MGLLDSLNLDDPKTIAMLSMGLGLMSPSAVKTNFGGQLSRAGQEGLLSYGQAKQSQMQQQTQERANRASDLQQLTGAYSFLRQQELPKMLTQGASYVPPPELSQMEARIGKLLDLGNLSGAIPGTPANGPSAPPQPPPTPTLPAPEASKYSLAVDPEQRAQGPMPQPPQAPQPPQGGPSSIGIGGPAGGVPMQAWLMTDPSGKSYMEQLAKDNAPQSTRYGIFGRNPQTGKYDPLGGALPTNALPYQFDAQGKPSVGAYPGQAETAAKMAAASSVGKGAGEFPFKTTNVTFASGATVPQLMSQAVGQPNLGPLASLFGGQPPQAPAQPPSQPAIPPAVQAAAAKGKPFEATQTPDGQVTVTNPQDPFADIPKRYVPQGMGQTSFDKEMASKQAEAASVTATKLGTQADAANQRIALNNQAIKLVDQADTGPKAALIGDVKNWLVSRVGIPESSFQNTPSATIALQKDLLNSATQRAKQQFGSRITQSEVMLMLTRGSPNVDMTKASIKYLIDSDNAMQGYQIKQANDFGAYLQKGGDPMRFESWYASKFPATQTLGQVHLKTEMGQSQPASAPRRVVHFGDLP